MKLSRVPLLVALALVLAACGTADRPALDLASSGPSASAEPETPPEDASASPTDVPSPEPSTASDALLETALVDVRSGESFTLAELAADGLPILLEPMAVWCSNCRAQQHEAIRAHELAEFTSVSLDIDLSERAEDLAAYADREGFAWRFAMADADLYRMLQDRFGIGVTNPPLTPLIVIEPDGTVRPLEFGQGIRSAEELLDELNLG